MEECTLRKVVINALQYRNDSSGIGVMLRELASRYTRVAKRPCEVVLCRDIEGFPVDNRTVAYHAPCAYGQGIRRVLYQLFFMGLQRCRDSLLLTTDAKLPLLLPKSCSVVPLITDLALFRLPETYQTSRLLLWRLQYHCLLRKADRYLAISEFTRRELTEVLHIPPKMVSLVPCACDGRFRRVADAQILAALRARYKISEHFVLFVGNTNPRKNLARLIRAFDMAKELGLPQQLIIAGGQGWKFDQESALADVRHRESIRFIGFVPDEDMPALYSAADAFLFPSLYEGFGMPVLEAQSCGVPVLTSNGSSLPEIGGDGAWYVDPYSEESICEGLMQLLQDVSLRQKLVERGYENVKRFSWERSANVLNEIVEEVVGA